MGIGKSNYPRESRLVNGVEQPLEAFFLAFFPPVFSSKESVEVWSFVVLVFTLFHLPWSLFLNIEPCYSLC